jgi:hypothetical protein
VERDFLGGVGRDADVDEIEKILAKGFHDRKGSQINYSCRFGCVVLSAGVPVTV